MISFFKINPKNVYLKLNKITANLDLKYVNLIVSSVEEALKYHAKYYLIKYNEIQPFELKALKDFLKMFNIDTIIDEVSSKEEIATDEELEERKKTLKGNYKIEDLILASKDDKTL